MADKNRREILTLIGASTVLVPMSALIASLPSRADDVPLVDENSVQARNWEYADISSEADKSCSNCALYQGDVGSIVGPCPLFPHMNVSVNALCNAYSPSPS